MHATARIFSSKVHKVAAKYLLVHDVIGAVLTIVVLQCDRNSDCRQAKAF